MKNKLKETGKKTNKMKREETEKLEGKTPKIIGNWMILKETGRNRK